jgi:hypothetical protein
VFEKKHAGIISRLLKSIGLEELVRRACAYLAMPEDRRFPRGSPTLEGLSLCINEVAGKCDSGTEEACFRMGILPADFDTVLTDFKPWEAPGGADTAGPDATATGTESGASFREPGK